jgi:hypothetical protein
VPFACSVTRSHKRMLCYGYGIDAHKEYECDYDMRTRTPRSREERGEGIEQLIM